MCAQRHLQHPNTPLHRRTLQHTAHPTTRQDPPAHSTPQRAPPHLLSPVGPALLPPSELHSCCPSTAAAEEDRRGQGAAGEVSGLKGARGWLGLAGVGWGCGIQGPCVVGWRARGPALRARGSALRARGPAASRWSTLGWPGPYYESLGHTTRAGPPLK